ncbi:hypothetical protein AWM68_17695 [Fictibacillus phosphorivorans]|uniref:Uncharacterized protein n=1 Tax=Fictibacillus phosphorivorans TaxID=1221500 RepID=A0A165NX18_9BACL|nr:hypothetical protein [Fictibacillus phosphorivorans]KZE68005.1 hypothetical protein AWM68_17695 [Fictibacillus phosphorivorans]
MFDDKIVDLIEMLLDKVIGWVVGPFRGNLDTLHTLIYGDGSTDLFYGVFDVKQFTVVSSGMALMQSISVGIILISIILAGMRISSAGINPANRTASFEYFKDFIVVVLLFFNLNVIFEVLYTVNSWFVLSFDSAKAITDGDIFDKTIDGAEKGPLGTLMIWLVLLGLWIWANFYYMMRTITLIILTIMSPLVVALYLIPQTKPLLGSFFKEYTGTVFVQSIHAALYWVITSVANEDFGLGSILLYMIFIPVSESLRSLIGLGGQMNSTMSKSAAMMGGAALSGIYGSVKGALQGETVAQSLRGAAGQVAGKVKDGVNSDGETSDKSVLAGAGTDIGTTSRAERMLRAGEILSKNGKAVFGAAGAIAGAPMGPMGSIIGSSVGFSGGGIVGGVAGRTGMFAAETGFNRLKAGAVAGWNKGKGILDAEDHADEKLSNVIANDETTKWADKNKDSFMKDLKERFPDASSSDLNSMWDKEISSKKSSFLEEARNSVGQLKETSGKHSKASDLVNATTNTLTNDWAKNNKSQFMKDYDANNPLPANPTQDDLLQHNQNKDTAWQQAVEGKRQAIGKIATNTANKLGNGITLDNSFINKDAFINDVGSKVDSEIGKGSRESITAVKDATSSVKGESLYVKGDSLIGKKSVNVELLNSQLAGLKTAQMKKSFLDQKIGGEGMTEEQAFQAWDQESPAIFKEHLSSLSKPQGEGGMPKHIPLDHSIIKNKFGQAAWAGAGMLGASIGGVTGLSEVSQFMGDSKIGQGFKTLGATAYVEFNKNKDSQNVITAFGDAIGTGTQQGWSAFKSHVPQDVIGRQAGFKNMVAMTTGVIGGVRGYQIGASYAAGNTQNTKGFGFKGFNPYNNAVNNQVAEISEIQQMAETVMGPNGQTIASGAIRMVTSNTETVLQVRDKTGNVKTVSRLGSGDSTLKKGQTIFQDLTIQDGQFTPMSNVYSEDSGGGRITQNRTINVNPNKIVANRNTPKNPRVVQEIQSYNQMVDSGQYYLKDVKNDMTDIQMVVDRNRSYLVGEKDGTQYRISPYGPGDTRLNSETVIQRKCEVQNNKLIVSQTTDYNSSLQPSDLIANRPPNKRTLARKQNEQFRNKSFAESLR